MGGGNGSSLSEKQKQVQYSGLPQGACAPQGAGKMYGEGLFVEDAFQNCVPKYYEEFLDKNTSVEPVDRPEIDVVSLDEKGLSLPQR